MATPHDGTGTYWDDTGTYPADDEPMYKGALEIRDLRLGLTTRLEKEHSDLGDSDAGVEHLQGSAISYSQAAAPTKRPDGDTVFTAVDQGRLWRDTDTDILYLLTNHAGPVWSPLNVPAGTVMFFYANVAPTGWTIYDTVVDCVLALKGGSEGYNQVAGDGAEKGTWTQPNHVHAGGSYTLETADIPSHAHKIKIGQGSGGSYDPTWSKTSAGNSLQNSNYDGQAAGGGGAHDHGNTGNGATANTYRPLAALGILATKDA